MYSLRYLYIFYSESSNLYVPKIISKRRKTGKVMSYLSRGIVSLR